MKTEKILSAEKFEPIGLENLPKGTYKGSWSGYEVEFVASGITYRLKVADGIRGINVKCKVRIGHDSVGVWTE